MAYKSKVKIIMKKDAYEDLKKGLKALDEATAFNKNILEYADKKETPRDGIILGWDWIKWDECTDEAVEYIMNFIAELNSPHKFIRIGEGMGTETDIDIYDHEETFEDFEFIDQLGWTIDITEHILEK